MGVETAPSALSFVYSMSLFIEHFCGYLGLSHKYPMIILAGEVALALHGTVVLALGLIQDDSYPFSRGEERVADVGDRAALALANHLHQGTHFDRPPAPV